MKHRRSSIVLPKNKRVENLKNKLRNRSLESMLWRVIGAALLFLMHITLGRYLSPENYGVYSFTLSIVTVLALVATMGWSKALLRLIPQYVSKQQWPLLKGVLIRCHQLSLGLAIFISVSLLIIKSFTNNEHLSNVLFYVSLLLPVVSLILLRRSIFQGFHCVKGSIIPDEIAFPSLMLAGLWLIKPSSVDDVVFLYASVAGGFFLLTLIWLYRLFPVELKKSNAVYDLKTWSVLAFPLLLGGLYQIILNQSGVLLLGAFGDMTDTGLFSASFRLAMLITFVMTGINVIGMPMMSTAFHNDDISSLRIINKKTRLWGFLGALPIFFVFILFPELALSLFGEEYRDAALMLQVIAFGQLGNAAVGLAGSLLNVAGEQVYFMHSMMVAAFVCVVAMVIVIPVWGAVGAACVYSVSIISLSLMQLLRANVLLSDS